MKDTPYWDIKLSLHTKDLEARTNAFNQKLFAVVSTLEAVQKIIAFYHDKDIDMLKLHCTLPNLVYVCLRKSTDGKFYPFTEGDKVI